MRQAIVSVEDQRFFDHDGIDLRGVAAPSGPDIRSQAIVEGGSTITQQFVKNAYIRNERTLAPKGARGGARLAARAALEQGPDPDRVPQHDLLRERRLRHPAGRTHLLQEERQGARAAPRPPSSPESRRTRRATTPSRTWRTRSCAGSTSSASCSSRGRSRAARTSARSRRRSRRGRGPAPGQRRACAVLRELREGPARREVRRGPCVRRGAQGHDDDRPPHAGARAAGDRADPSQPGRPGRRAGRDRPEDRRREGDVRRPQLP